MPSLNKRCPCCLGVSSMTEWQPSKGLEPRLREFKCKCGYHFFRELTLGEMKRIGAIEKWVKK